jgi:hypothetical protein
VAFNQAAGHAAFAGGDPTGQTDPASWRHGQTPLTQGISLGVKALSPGRAERMRSGKASD